MAANPSRLSYFSLPGEVRNKIMEYVLVGVDVHPCKAILEAPTRSQDTAARAESRPGVQLIATCKQAYVEGHGLFYSSNTFHLPPNMAFLWPERLQAKHRAMIKRVSITIGLVELTPAMLNQVERNMPALVGQKNGICWALGVLDVLLEMWKAKMRYIAAWDSLEEIEVRSFGRIFVLRHHEFVAHLAEIHVAGWGKLDTWVQNPYWRDTLRRSRLYVLGNISAKVECVGWKRTRGWLHARKPGEMAKGFMVGESDMTEKHRGIVRVIWRT